MQSVHKVNSSSEWLPAVQTLGFVPPAVNRRGQLQALWMTKSCCSHRLTPRWRHRLDISNTLALAVLQGRPCPLVTEWLVWHSNGGDTRRESRIQHERPLKGRRTVIFHPLTISDLRDSPASSSRIICGAPFITSPWRDVFDRSKDPLKTIRGFGLVKGKADPGPRGYRLKCHLNASSLSTSPFQLIGFRSKYSLDQCWRFKAQMGKTLRDRKK